jgi:hypothetical protein
MMKMSDDLVKRLRKVEPDAPGERTRWYRNPDGAEAADHIEQLEAALRKIADGPRDADKSYAELFVEVCMEARAALGEKKDD